MLLRTTRLAVCLILPVTAALASADHASTRTLTFQQRVEAQRLLDRIEYGHRVGATGPFEELIPLRMSEDRVRGTLARSAALESYWAMPVTQAELQKELERIARDTLLPERLKEIYAALGDDPMLVREAFVRPILVERLVRELVAADERIQANPRAQAERLRADLVEGRLSWQDRHPLRELQDRAESRQENARVAPGSVGPIIDGHDAFFLEIPIERGPRSEKVAVYRIGKVSFDQWWNGEPRQPMNDRLVIDAGTDAPLPQPVFDAGTRKSLAAITATDYWDNGVLDDIPAPAGAGPAIWTGLEMFVFSGSGSSGRYDPLADSWRPISTLNQPAPGTAVWTGSEMITWSGYAGGRYIPGLDRWIRISTVGAPVIAPAFGLGVPSAVWTGQEMIVFGGDLGTGGFEVAPTNQGGRYNPVTDSWVRTPFTGAPTPRVYHTAVWTGTAMIVWGGAGTFGALDPDGASFDPATGLWTPISTTGDPSEREHHSAIWTGSEMIVWGGVDDLPLGDGARYDPVLDSWTPVALTDAPSNRFGHAAIWTDSQMIVWGGESNVLLGAGGRYDPGTDSWTPVTTTGAPPQSFGQSAVWTGDSMIVWGIYISGGGRYYPDVTNLPPEAVILGNHHVECMGTLTLDGSQSFDPEGGTLTYEWFASYAPYPGAPLGTGPTLSLTLSVIDRDPGGPITLRVTDPGGATGRATVGVEVSDTIPPDMICPAPITVECAGAIATPVSLPLPAASDSCFFNDITWSRAEEPANVPFASNNFVYGTTLVTYTATPTFGPSANCTIAVTVRDTTPPAISVTATPNQLWPANHGLVEVVSTVNASDTCGTPDIVLRAVTSSEPDDAPGGSDGATTGDIREADVGTMDLQCYLRAERDENGTGRTYTILYEAIDAVGLRSTASTLVTVPLQRVRVKPR